MGTFSVEQTHRVVKVNDYPQQVFMVKKNIYQHFSIIYSSDLQRQKYLVVHRTRGQHEGWAQDYGNSNIFLKPLFRGNLDPFVNNANLGAIAHTSNGT